MSDDPLPDYPTDDPHTLVYHVARTGIDAAASIVPGAGYALGKIIDQFVTEPLQKRRDDWFHRIGMEIQDLQKKLDSFDAKKLIENDDFISAIYESTQAAMKTRNEEKLTALRNGVTNIASGMTLDEIVRGAFFGLIDRFSSAHLMVLKLLADPSSSPGMVADAAATSLGSPYATLCAGLPIELKGGPSLDRILSDLTREELINYSGFKTTSSKEELLKKRTTILGDNFIIFISAPEEWNPAG